MVNKKLFRIRGEWKALSNNQLVIGNKPGSGCNDIMLHELVFVFYWMLTFEEVFFFEGVLHFEMGGGSFICVYVRYASELIHVIFCHIMSYGQQRSQDCESTRDRVTNWLYLFLVSLQGVSKKTQHYDFA